MYRETLRLLKENLALFALITLLYFAVPIVAEWFGGTGTSGLAFAYLYGAAYVFDRCARDLVLGESSVDRDATRRVFGVTGRLFVVAGLTFVGAVILGVLGLTVGGAEFDSGLGLAAIFVAVVLTFVGGFAVLGTLPIAHSVDAGRGFGRAFKRGRSDFAFAASRIIGGPIAMVALSIALAFVSALALGATAVTEPILGADGSINWRFGLVSLVAISVQVVALFMLAVVCAQSFVRQEGSNASVREIEAFD